MEIPRLLRLEYLFSVLLSCFLAIYFNHLPLFPFYIPMLVGWSFLGITGNVLNDMIDKDRDLPFTDKELGTVAMVSFGLGFMLIIRYMIFNLINLILVIAAMILVIAYCLWLKRFPILNKFVLVFSHVIIPYIVIKIPSPLDPRFLSEIFLLAGLFFFGVSGQVVHELVDKEASMKFSLQTNRIFILSCCIASIVFFLMTMILTMNVYFIPFLFAPMGTIYMFRRVNRPRSQIKTIGIIVGNLLMIYVITLIFIC
ncbi:MAG: hypothetical protein ACXQS8_00445 [Candidatus Helarchaeales archaeon]